MWNALLNLIFMMLTSLPDFLQVVVALLGLWYLGKYTYYLFLWCTGMGVIIIAGLYRLLSQPKKEIH